MAHAKRQTHAPQVEASPNSFWVGIMVLVVLGLAVFALFKFTAMY